MTVEQEQGDDKPRRKFDDVASLFGGIVPAPLAVPRPIKDYPAPQIRLEPQRPPPPPAPPPPAPPPPPPPPVVAAPAQPEPAREPEAKPAPRPPPRPRPTPLPWPDAFEPRPNYRRREPRNWSWLLLIPVGFVAAVGITTVDPRAIKSWLDDKVLHRTSMIATTEAPLLSTPPSDPAPVEAPPPAPPPEPAPAPITAPNPAPAAETPVPYQALPTSPAPVPPGTEVSPPPVDPAQPAPPAAPVRITIQYRRNIPGADGEARRIATLLQGHGGSVELHPNTATTKAPTINYYNASDKAAATALAGVLSNEAVNWVVRLGAVKYPPGTLDIWLP